MGGQLRGGLCFGGRRCYVCNDPVSNSFSVIRRSSFFRSYSFIDNPNCEDVDSEVMSKRLKTLLFVAVMAVGAFGGAPLSASGAMDGNKICPMKCCKKAAKAKETAKHHQMSFCNLTSCSETVPSAPSTSNVAQASSVFIPAEKKDLFRILDSTKPKDVRKPRLLSGVIPQETPFFLKHNSFLI